jgi:DNA primase
MAYGGMGYVDAVKDLASGVGMQMPEFRPRTKEEVAREERATDLYEVMEKAMEFYRAELKKSPRAIEYLKGRGLTGEIAARFRIGYAPDGWQGLNAAFEKYEDKSLVECGLVIEGEEGKRYDRFRDRVMFPILSQRGQTIGFGGRVMGEGEPKYLNSPETPLFEKGREVYGLVQARDAIRAAGRVLVVEGYMDVVALAQFDVGYAVATLGTATTPVHVSKLLRLADEIVFCFDGDAAGRKAAWRALEVSLPLAPDNKPIRFLFLPEADDPDTYVRREGKAAFEALVGSGQTLSGFLLAELRSQFELETPEGRSGFLSAAKPQVQKIEAPALKLQIVKEVARLGGVTQEEAERILGLAVASPSGGFRNAAPPRKTFNPPSSVEWKVLTSVVAFPALIGELELEHIDKSLPESRALAALADRYLSTDGDRSGAMLVEHFQGGPHADLLFGAQAHALEFDESEEEARQAIRHGLWKLEIHHMDGEIKALGEKLSRGQLSKEEHLRYGRMISEVSALKRRLQEKGRPAER